MQKIHRKSLNRLYRARSLLNPSQEKFCIEYLKDFDEKRAFTATWPNAVLAQKTINQTSARLLKLPTIRARIKELQLKERTRMELTVHDIVKKLEAAYNGAMSAEQYGAAIRALELLGKHLGMFVEKHVHLVQIAGIEGTRDPTVALKDVNNLLGILDQTAPKKLPDPTLPRNI